MSRCPHCGIELSTELVSWSMQRYSAVGCPESMKNRATIDEQVSNRLAEKRYNRIPDYMESLKAASEWARDKRAGR